MNVKTVFAAVVALSLGGCSLAYNDPARFMGRLSPDELATIEPPLQDTHPDRPMLRAPNYSHEYAHAAGGHTYGNWSR